MTERARNIEAARLVAAIYPTRFERTLAALSEVCWKLGGYERGPLARLGHWLDSWKVDHWHRRADHGREMAGKR